MASVELMALAAPRVATALACWLTGNTTEAWRIADDVLRCTTEREVPQAQAVAAVTAAIMAQLDGDRDAVIRLAGRRCGRPMKSPRGSGASGPLIPVVGR